MARKFTQEEMEKIFEEQGCTLLSEHKGCKTHLEYICSCGNKSKIRFDKFRQGQRCRDCASRKITEKQLFSYEYVKNFFSNEGCTLLSDSYEGARNHRLKFICSCGDIAEKTFDSFKNGARCDKCSNYKRWQSTMKSLYENGTAPTSDIQIVLCNMVNGELNYPIGTSLLDVALLDEKIYVEYNGGGHRLRVAHGLMTDEEFDKKEMRRRYSLYDKGWKELRIVSKTDYIPLNYDELEQLVNDGLEYLRSSGSWYEIDFDNKTIKNSKYQNSFNIELIRYRKGRFTYEKA
jgi:rRNA pseudouridine-1189 N-methylase Emg1 (Nep1/Mra1 family)